MDIACGTGTGYDIGCVGGGIGCVDAAIGCVGGIGCVGDAILCGDKKQLPVCL